MKVKSAWETFAGNHPKFPAFLSVIKQKGIHEGDVIAISITGADGKPIEMNMKITASDLKLFETLKDIS